MTVPVAAVRYDDVLDALVLLVTERAERIGHLVDRGVWCEITRLGSISPASIRRSTVCPIGIAGRE